MRGFTEEVRQHSFSFKSKGRTKRIQNRRFGVTQNATEPLDIIVTKGEHRNILVCLIQLIIDLPLIGPPLLMLELTNINAGMELLKPICSLIADYVLNPKKECNRLDQHCVEGNNDNIQNDKRRY